MDARSETGGQATILSSLVIASLHNRGLSPFPQITFRFISSYLADDIRTHTSRDNKKCSNNKQLHYISHFVSCLSTSSFCHIPASRSSYRHPAIETVH
ncbi:hypothetical protein EMIT0P228_150089 [Pseudomonas brassicacearum]